jgi:hypothetical protein
MSALAIFTFGGLSFRSVHVHANPILPCREAASQALYLIRSQIFLKLGGKPLSFIKIWFRMRKEIGRGPVYWGKIKF